MQLGITCPGTADQYDIVGTVYKISTMELTDEGFFDGRGGAELGAHR